MRVALATCLELPEPDPDAELLSAELARLGAEARLLAWDDPAADPALVDLCVIRSTWNYIHRREAFLDWAERAAKATELLNPPSIVRWNTDKAYLGELESRGVSCVPTVYVERGSRKRLAEVLRPRGWTDVVIKPRVGAASFATRLFRARELDEGERFLAGLVEERDVLVQPYLPSVETSGERALVWIDGELTHAVRKSPRFTAGAEAVSQALPVARDERAFAERVLAPYASELLYARVDVARDEGGAPILMELELVEPSLFLAQEPRALARFARAIVARATAPA